jgi:hypothetical protein
MTPADGSTKKARRQRSGAITHPSPSKDEVKGMNRSLKRKIEELEKEVDDKQKTIEKQANRIAHLISVNEYLQDMVPTEEEKDAVDCLYAGNISGALRLFEEASIAYDKELGERVAAGKKAQSDAFQTHLLGIAPEICYGLDGLSQRQFQRMIAMLGRHTAVESGLMANYERTRPKRSGGYAPRKLSAEKTSKRQANASIVYEWLEEVLGDDFLESEKDYREQLQAADGGTRQLRLGVVGLTCSKDGLLMLMQDWFTKAGAEESGAHTHIGRLKCRLQSKSDPPTVDDEGDLYDNALDNRTKNIRNILLQDPDKRLLSDPDHPFWVKVSKGEEDDGKQGVGKAGFQCRDMQVMGCVIKLRLPQATVNDLMNQYMRARQYRGMYLRCGELVDFASIANRERMVQYNKETEQYELVPPKPGRALVFSAREDIKQFIKTHCSQTGGFKANPKCFYSERGVEENMADIRVVVTHGSGRAYLAALPEEEWEANTDDIADFCWELYNTLRTLHWYDHAAIHQRSVYMATRAYRCEKHQWKQKGHALTLIRRQLETPSIESVAIATSSASDTIACVRRTFEETDKLEERVCAVVDTDSADDGDSGKEVGGGGGGYFGRQVPEHIAEYNKKQGQDGRDSCKSVRDSAARVASDRSPPPVEPLTDPPPKARLPRASSTCSFTDGVGGVIAMDGVGDGTNGNRSGCDRGGHDRGGRDRVGRDRGGCDRGGRDRGGRGDGERAAGSSGSDGRSVPPMTLMIGGRAIELGVIASGIKADKGAAAYGAGCQAGGSANTSFCDVTQYATLGDFRSAVRLFCKRWKSFTDTNNNVKKCPVGRSGNALNGKIGAKALKLALFARGKTEESMWPAYRGAPIFREVMGGDVRAPAPVGLDPVEAAERLKKPLYSQLAVLDCALHDLKGEAALNDKIIHSRQSGDKKRQMNRAKVENGQGPTKGGMCGRDWRAVIASGDIYAMCTEEEQELQLTLSIMSDTGLYKPPEEYCNKNILMYSLYATSYSVQKKALFGINHTGKPIKGVADGQELPTSHPLGGVTLAAVFGRYFKAVAFTDVLTYRLEPLRDGSTEREEETYAEVKHRVDKSFFAGDIEESMLNGINRCAGMAATSKKLRQTSDPTGKGEGTARRKFDATMKNRGKDRDYEKVFVVPKKMLLSDDWAIWLLMFPDTWIRDEKLGLTGPRIFRELEGDENEYTRPDGFKVRGVVIDLTLVDDEGVMARFTSRCDNRETLMQYLIDKILRPCFYDKDDASDVFVPSWGAAQLRAWIQNKDEDLQKRLGMGVGDSSVGGDFLADLRSNATEATDALDVDEAIQEEEKRAQQEEELEQDKRMLLLLEEQSTGINSEITRRVNSLNSEGEGAGEGGGGGGGRGVGGSDQATEEDIEATAESIDGGTGPAELAVLEETFMANEVQDVEVHLECIYPQPEARASRAVRESTANAREAQQQIESRGRWGCAAECVDDDDDDEADDLWEQELMPVEIDRAHPSGGLRQTGQHNRLRAYSAARGKSGGALLGDRRGAGSAQAAELDVKKKRRQIGALAMHKEYVKNLYSRLKKKIDSLEAELRGGPGAAPSAVQRGDQLQQSATSAALVIPTGGRSSRSQNSLLQGLNSAEKDTPLFEEEE